MASIKLDGVRKVFPNGHVALRGLDLLIPDGELLVLVGPSGCGKSTLLRLVAGLEDVSAGRIRIGDEDVTDRPPQQRDLAMVFQSYALYPHMTVRENLAFGLRMRGLARAAIAERVAQGARLLELDGVLDRLPRQLSGGQRQRVALGRAIVREPRAFLLDEPLSNLDAALRVQTRAELARLHRRLGATILYVTHDQEEALTLGNRVAVLRDGVLEQIGPPMHVYDAPGTRFVAEFVGSPAMNLLRGELVAEGGGRRMLVGGHAFSLDEAPPGVLGPVWLGVRPHDALLATTDADVRGRVDVREPLGPHVLLHLALDGGGRLRVLAPPDGAAREDDVLGIRLRRDRLHFFDARTEQRLA